MKGYVEAEKLDALINKLVKEHSITKENARMWLAFTRTVATSLHIIELEARKVLGLKESDVL